MTRPCLPEVVERVRFPAGPLLLGGELAYPGGGSPAGAAVLSGPHPLLGGTRQNNVVRGLGDGLAARGLVTLRFDYRGVGDSDGPRADVARNLAEFWRHSRISDEERYQEDLHAAVAFLRSAAGPSLPLALIGYSFGCTLLPALAGPASALVLIAPPLGKRELTGFETLSQPRLVIAPEGDFAAESDQVQPWFDRLVGPCELLQPRLDGHFFRGQGAWLTEAIGSFLDRHWRRDP